MKLYKKGNTVRQGTRFFSYRQNNSGGSFDYLEEAGISVTVIVEALSYSHANREAQGIGLYFDGYGDCSCCGNRWSEPWETSGFTFQEALAQIADEMAGKWSHKWREQGEAEIFVHTLDGSLYGFWLGEEEDDIFLKNYLGGTIKQWQL